MSNRINELRKQQGLTQQQLAQKLGLSKATIAMYESEKTENIKMENILKMEQILDASPAYIMGWSNTRYEMSPRESKLLKNFRSLNPIGKNQLEIRLWELSQLSYTTQDIIKSKEEDFLTPVAAHADNADAQILQSEIERVKKIIDNM